LIGVFGSRYLNKENDKHRRVSSEKTIKGIGYKAGQVVGLVYLLAKTGLSIPPPNKRYYSQRSLCSMLEILLYQEEKHKLIAEICVSGIIISNGFLVEHLIGYLNDNSKGS